MFNVISLYYIVASSLLLAYYTQALYYVYNKVLHKDDPDSLPQLVC